MAVARPAALDAPERVLRVRERRADVERALAQEKLRPAVDEVDDVLAGA
jgi:hypothetical protein